MKVGDLVRENWGQQRIGVIVEKIPKPNGYRRLFKVLWNKHSPSLPTLVGPAWEPDLEVIRGR